MKHLNLDRLVLVSNRIPVVLTKEEGRVKVKSGHGGLISALAPILRKHKGLWIGWTGSAELTKEEIDLHMQDVVQTMGFPIAPVMLTEEEIELYYHGFSNEVIWPLFHDFQSECNYDPEYWHAYQKVNRKFAEAVLENVQERDFLWVQDYHMLLLAQELRKRGFSSYLSFFMHIPFPPLELFMKLPWRFQILNALLQFDLIGFQTMRDKRNFVHCVHHLLPDYKGKTKKGVSTYQIEDRSVHVAAFPISIDYQELDQAARNKEISERAWYFHEKLRNEKIVFSLDRLDFTKGIPYRLRAIDHLLDKHPELHRKISFVQVVVPSRIGIPKYQELKNEIDRLVGKINSKHTKDDWVPIKYIFRSLEQAELHSYYRASEIALVTPFKDGMNLVSKEYIASNVEENGVLILSEFAGSAAQLSDEALLVNPYDIEGISEAIYTALNLSEKEKRRRMQKMRRDVRKYDVFWWIRSYLNAAISDDPEEFSFVEEYLPTQEEDKRRKDPALLIDPH